MQNYEHILGDVSLQTFLQEYWQQKPLLIRNAIPNYISPISADEMAGLACEEDVESRIIIERSGDSPWQCQHGPFEVTDFSKMPESHWTLLIQSCNLHVSEFSQLLEKFRFIPNWRVDDIMVSYAAPGGSVGPHVDNYDVFLLQAQGTRHWNISRQKYDQADFVPELDIKILKSFNAEESWELTAGDMLYLPPGVAHYGIAADQNTEGDDCITISVGFRAPNLTELSTALLDEILSQQSTSSAFHSISDFYQDPRIGLQDNPGEISIHALNKITNMVQQEITSKLQDSDWFGKYVTSTDENISREELLTDVSMHELLQPLLDGQQLVRTETSKLVFFITANDNTSKIHFFCNGQVEYHPPELLTVITLVCNHRYPPITDLIKVIDSGEAKTFLATLIGQGHLYFEQDIDDDED